MRILILAPQPFYQERGTPIAVGMLARSLGESGHEVDLLVFHEGEAVAYPNVRLRRIPAPPGIRNVRPGFSAKKLVCDLFLMISAWKIVRTHRPDVIHAVEEAVFIAWLFKRLFGIPYIYDMDSSLPDQIVEKAPRLRVLSRPLHLLMRAAVFPAMIVAPVCEELAEVAEGYGNRHVRILRDISLLPRQRAHTSLGLRERLQIKGLCFMYMGNLEHYQGMDLLIESFARMQQPARQDALVIIGGEPADVAKYQTRATALGVAQQVHFLGRQPIEYMADFFAEADVLVSPRIKGTNTPMKIYSYLDSGKPVLATDLPTHTQVLNPDVAELAAPDPAAFADAMKRLAGDAPRRRMLGENGRRLVESRYTYAAYRGAVEDLYRQVVEQGRTLAPSPRGNPRA